MENLKTITNETLYELLNKREDFETALLIKTQLENLKLCRYEKFKKKMDEAYFKPFTKQSSYDKNTPNYMIFSGWQYRQKYSFQLDIVHYKNRTEFIFYETKGNMTEEETKTFLYEIIGQDCFRFRNKINGNNQFLYLMRLDTSYESLSELDEQVVQFSKNLFRKIKAFDAV